MSSEMIAHCSYQDISRDASYPSNRAPLKSRNFILKKVQKTYKKFQDRPLPPEFKPRLDGPSVTWRIFSRLAMAIEYADSSTSDCMIFSFEEKIGSPGQRLFLVTSPQKMWATHSAKQPKERCTYEVIRENHPCKLYFDLEFYTSFNCEKDGNSLTNTLIKCVIASMYEQHNLLLKESDFLWLDASNDEKFSSHLILQTKGVAFQNNIHAGMFVCVLSSTLRKRMDENLPSNEFWPSAQEIKNLLVKSKKGKDVFFYDEGVYTKNRNFRMYLSIKQGKKSPLVLSSCNKYVPLVHPEYRKEAFFYDSLVTYFRSQKICKMLSYEENREGNILNNSLSRMKIDKPGISGCASSPFPELDNFVLGIIKDENAVGFIRKWTYVSNAQKIVYDIGNYRFCGNIGRHHKSNNIKIVIDMKMKCYYQTCLDPECRQEHYQSEAVAVPDEIVCTNVPDDFFDENPFSELQSVDNVIEGSELPDFSDELFQSCTKENFVEKNSMKSNETIHENNYDNNRTLPHTNLCQDMDFDFEDFSEFSEINHDIQKKVENHVEKDENSHQSWDAFFNEDFTPTQENVNQGENGHASEDFSFPKDGFWDTQPVTKDSAVSLGNISFEEELLMADAAEAIEATMNESDFLEETIF